jgi:hypothetical protein
MKLRLTAYFHEFSEHRALRFMPRIVSIMLLVLWLMTLPYCTLIWGPNNVVMRSGMPNSILENLVFHLYYRPGMFPWIYSIHALSLLLALWNTAWSFVPRLVGWFTGLMLYNTAPGLYGSGALLLLAISFFLIPVHYGTMRPWRQWLNSTSLIAMRLQTLVVLITISLFMWGSNQWKEGTALYYLSHQTSNIRQFASSIVPSGNSILHLLTYTVLLTTTAMPILFIWRHTRYFGVLLILLAGIVSLPVFTNMAIGFAILVLAMPWLDARDGYDS